MDDLNQLLNQTCSQVYSYQYYFEALLKRGYEKWQNDDNENYQIIESLIKDRAHQLRELRDFYQEIQKKIEQKRPASQEQLCQKKHSSQILKHIQTDMENKSYELSQKKECTLDRYHNELNKLGKGYYQLFSPLSIRLKILLKQPAYYIDQFFSRELKAIHLMTQFILQSIRILIGQTDHYLHNDERICFLKSREKKQKQEAYWRKKRAGERILKKKQAMKKYFDLLKIPVGSEMNEVKKSWYRLVKKHHPDRHDRCRSERERAKRITQQLNKAYQEICLFHKEYICR